MTEKPLPGHSKTAWLPGQRVSRTDTDDLGTVIESDGDIKVKWDNGQTSYFERHMPSNLKRVED